MQVANLELVETVGGLLLGLVCLTSEGPRLWGAMVAAAEEATAAQMLVPPEERTLLSGSLLLSAARTALTPLGGAAVTWTQTLMHGCHVGLACIPVGLYALVARFDFSDRPAVVVAADPILSYALVAAVAAPISRSHLLFALPAFAMLAGAGLASLVALFWTYAPASVCLLV